MAYEKQIFVPGQILTADHLNHIEDGIEAASSGSAGGSAPVRGVDYWTEEDKAEIKSYVDEAILGGAW